MPQLSSPTRHGALPLCALLSQVLVAFTIELDNEFARRMGESGYPTAGLSWIIWSNLIRFIGEGITVRELEATALSPDGGATFGLGCLERWGFISLLPAPDDARPIRVGRKGKREGLREGWGSGRGIRNEWIVRLTAKGQKSAEIWPPLFPELERRWQARFGAEQIGHLRKRSEEIADQIDLELPQALPPDYREPVTYPSCVTGCADNSALLTLLSQILLAFTVEFERQSKTSLSLCANVPRVLGNGPVRLADLPRLTGGSPERTAIGWQLKPYVSVEPDPKASRGKIARLTARGKQAEQSYYHTTAEVEKRWRLRFGDDAITGLRESLLQLFEDSTAQQSEKQNARKLSPLSQGLVPPPGVARGGAAVPALGRRKMASAARQRVRDLVAQTEMFVRDPAGTLPHYPLWDMNRGFGP